MSCIACLQGFKWECRDHGSCGGASSSSISIDNSTPDTAGDSELEEVSGPIVEIRTQDDSKLKDQQSTGRKRAAKMYPLDETKECDWRSLSNCGGGSHPITGCIRGNQQARHHGPDKNTLNNEAGNVHRICHNCHNRWHSRNDADYIWGSNYAPHNPETASEEELVIAELAWTGVKLSQVKD
jgi:hypothetical protein